MLDRQRRDFRFAQTVVDTTPRPRHSKAMRVLVAAVPFMPFAFGSVMFMLVASTARADVPPPNAAGCDGKKVAESCEQSSGAPGTCAASTCTRLDYGNRNDAGAPTPAAYDCLLCQPGSASDGGATADAGETTNKDAGGCASTGSPVSYGAALALGSLALAWSAYSRRRRS